VVGQLGQDVALRNDLEQGAFESGSSVTTVLFVGAIYIRDRVLKELGLRPEDINTHDPDIRSE
jgi:hypothetical protein